MGRLNRITEVIEETRKEKPKKKERLAFSSGSTLLNLALADNPYYGFVPGKLVNIIGDSSAGKSFLLWTVFAEIAHDKRFDDYEIIYDEPEVSFEFDIPKLFGGKTEKRVQTDIRSETMEDFHDNVIKAVGRGKPIIYGLDSFDALTSEAEMKREVRDGTYGMEKPKLAGIILRKICGKIADTGSAVFIISQTRDNIGVTFGSKKTRSGGKALKFYSTHELWLAVESHVKRKEREVGVNVLAKISKNKVTGKLRTVSFPLIYDYGIDNYISLIEWLLDEKVWKKDGRKIETNGFCDLMSMENIIIYIIENNLTDKLIKVVQEAWEKIEESVATIRPSRYE
jgi:RecA/RadA recombinase